MIKQVHTKIVIILLCAIFIFPNISIAKSPTMTVDINGVDPETNLILQSQLSIKASEKERKLTLERVEVLHELAKEEILNTLEGLGYYHASVTSQVKEIPGGFYATFNIQKGKATIVQSIHVRIEGDGQCEDALQELTHSPTPKNPFIRPEANTRLIHSEYETYKQELLGKALNLGYLDAEFSTNEIQLSEDKYKANIVLVLNTGHRYYFGKVQYALTPYPPEFLNRLVPIKPGTPYTTEGLLSFQKAFTESDLFNLIRIYPLLEETENYEVPIKIRLKRKPLNKYTTSFGFGTDTGPRGLVAFEHRLERFAGHRFGTDVQISKRRKQGNVQYTIPGRNPSTDRLIFGLQAIEERIVAETHSKRLDLSVTNINRLGQWQQILALVYRAETFREFSGEPNQSSHYLLPTANYLWTNVKKSVFRQHGSRLGITFRGGVDLLSGTQLLQIETKAKHIFPIGDNARLLVRGDIGTTVTTKSNHFPSSLRFFTGGDHTVRGYGYKTLGPTKLSPDGKYVVVGGSNLLVGSVEFERRLYNELSGAIFLDGGNAMNKWKTHLHYSAGFGVRFGTPLGPLRLDIAQPLKHGKASPRLHLTFGLDL